MHYMQYFFNFDNEKACSNFDRLGKIENERKLCGII